LRHGVDTHQGRYQSVDGNSGPREHQLQNMYMCCS